ncbi:Pkinase-domain-containing protein [Rickenella mellea]|uniref:non-specific serine/threonine protein kinase n=1 Tax=Rickenella mellea TaxID=50990 RepID=A0A4Y7Q0F3_9AGAM|nr:Pkinase-domain-containing protein [Rickenella mellea]
MSSQNHQHSATGSQNHKAQLANAYNELGKELSSFKIKVVGNYTLGKAIGEGAYGKVRLGTHRLTQTRVAIKQIPKSMTASLTREIHHHRRLHHPHVAQLYEVIATESAIWLVTELCSGGELFDYLVEKGRLSEDETRTIFGQLCLAVGYIHEKGVVHRDLKLENVLLDERCRVKLGDFGFTREYERGSLLETFCGTTGYASPEMLQAKKYLGPEVDIWSLGIILYTLLTGTLPFDDDDEMIMRDKIIIGSYEDPQWLSTDARDLICNLLQQDPTKRLTIPQILGHKWFSHPSNDNDASSSTTSLPISPAFPTPSPSAAEHPTTFSNLPPEPSSAGTSPSSFHSASSRLSNSAPTTPDDMTQDLPDVGGSQRTVKKKTTDADGGKGPRPPIHDDDMFFVTPTPSPSKPSPSIVGNGNSSSSSKPPSSFPTRTPARTKRRSVSSVLSQPSSPTTTSGPGPAPLAPQDYASVLAAPAPLLFSTPLERSLLNNLSSLGFDTGQMVHSVLSDACDSSGAVWWMLKRRAEKKAMEDALRKAASAVLADVSAEIDVDRESKLASPRSPSPSSSVDEPTLVELPSARSAPQLTFVPPTPTVPTTNTNTTQQRTVTPPRSKSPRSLLSATPTTTESATKSTPSTPGSSLREKDKDKDKEGGSKGRREGKQRSGSVSIMQRATTALEAAGLVRKKSQEAVREREREREEKEKEKEKERKDDSKDYDKDKDKRPSTTDSRGSHSGSTSHSHPHPNRLTKSPPMRAVKDPVMPMPPSTPEQEVSASSLTTTSPWVLPVSGNFALDATAPTPANSPGDSIGALPSSGLPSGKLTGPRNRNSILSTFRMWFNEDRKGKRKAMAASSSSPNIGLGSPTSPPPNPARNRGTVKRRGSGSGGNMKHRAGNRQPPASSRRSSSVNSRRSSVASMQMVLLESPLQNVDEMHIEMPFISRQRSDPSRRSFTPVSEAERDRERGEYQYASSSRPSSIRSGGYNKRRTRHKKSPSNSSAGSTAHQQRTASPLQKYHRRTGSGSSTRVVRQPKPSTSGGSGSGSAGGGTARQWHVRSNSTTSSIHSLPSSRPASFYDVSEGEGQRTGSPFQLSHGSPDETPRRGTTAHHKVLAAHKKTTPFMSPSGGGAYGGYGGGSYLSSYSRTSWKKSWGVEPPGWQSRPTQMPVEVLVISAGSDAQTSIRDVFSGRGSLTLSPGDEDDWEDEDDDIPALLGGVGQTPTTANSTSSASNMKLSKPESPMLLAPAPRGKAAGRSTKRNNADNNNLSAPVGAGGARSGSGRSKPGHSPIAGNSPLPSETSFDAASSSSDARLGRRQLPAGRSGPAFRHPIQEEDEGEEEE